MTTVAYCHPLVPPEWIAAHGLRPHWLRLRAAAQSPTAARGVCPYAAALADAVCAESAWPARPFAAAVATTACDQMRYAAALADEPGAVPLFLMNIPSTWQTATAGRLYRDELRRLGRFFQRHGGTSPRPEDLARVMREYARVRAAIQAAQGEMSARQFAEALAAARDAIEPARSLSVAFRSAKAACLRGVEGQANAAFAERKATLVPLALVGGPLLETDFPLHDLIEEAGGRIVLDATEGGQRTLPAEFDAQRLDSDPFEELARAYFDAFPDAFRRPDHQLYEWLGREMAARGVRGLLFRRYVWCDLWHAELPRLKAWSPAPVLDLDGSPDDQSARARTLNRIEAFVETLA